MKSTNTQTLALLSMLTALSIALSYLHLPTPTGILTLLDVGICFTAFYLGKREGAIVGGLSALLCDLLLGYPQWAFFSLLFHGAQGYFAGWAGKNRLIGLVLSSLSMVGGYFLATIWLYDLSSAVQGSIGNLLQQLAGLVGGYVLLQAIKQIGGIRHVAK